MRKKANKDKDIIEVPLNGDSSAEPTYKAKGKVWVEKGGEVYMGWGRVELLEQIDKLGSIAAAARKMGMGYRNAWLEVEDMNRLAPKPLVIKMLGGAGGGQAILTAEGQKIINEYKELRTRFQEFLENFR
ncbi:MAG: LysR family transcriptional regulator [Dehalococcoidales bacterium]|nr:LysR family transcriptional regulator [Dehalococcoidales bacterium]